MNLAILLSGAACLAHEVIWNRYLSILLGSQNKASSLTLAVFFSGLAVGYHLWKKASKQVALLCFIFAELLLALWAILLPFFYQQVYEALPQVFSLFGVKNYIVDIFISLLLLAIPSLLMGATLPLLTVALSESVLMSSKRHSFLYGLNTVGGTLGALFTGFYLIPEFGLQNASFFTASINIISAGIAYQFLQNKKEFFTTSIISEGSTEKSHLRKLLYCVAFSSGFLIITLECAIFRLVNLSIGFSVNEFALVISVFVLSLGIGSLFIKNIQRYTLLKTVQIQLLGLGILIVFYISGEYWSEVIEWIRQSLPRSLLSFYLYEISIYTFLVAVLVLPLSFLGLTMPLCFHHFEKKESEIGFAVSKLYSTNAIGGATGALIGGYGLYYLFNLSGILKVCLLLALFNSTIFMLRAFLTEKKERLVFSISLLIFIGIILLPNYQGYSFFDPFNFGNVLPKLNYKKGNERLYYKDGPESSLYIGAKIKEGKEYSRFILMNGKSDGDTRWDYDFTSLLGILPGIFAPSSELTAVIGLGPGITTQSIANFKSTKQVEVAELSQEMVEQIHFFDPYNGNLSKNKKVTLHSIDGFRYLMGVKNLFNVIISAPSNPWLGRTENLYTEEYYRLVRKRLKPQGVFVQWLNNYNMNEEIFKKILRTTLREFLYVNVFELGKANLAILASEEEIEVNENLIRSRIKDNPIVEEHLKSLGFKDASDLMKIVRLDPKETILLSGRGKTYSLNRPALSRDMLSAFFKGEIFSLNRFKNQNLLTNHPLSYVNLK